MSGISGIGRIQSYNYYRRSEQNLRSQQEKLASGKKINRAADNAAGAAIAQKIVKELGGLDAAGNNIKSGISAANVADGAMAGITDYMQSINELSIQSMNGLYSDSDRQAIQNQIDQYKQGIGQIAQTAKFNETNLLDGSKSSVNIASGPDGSGTQMPLVDGTLQKLGLQNYNAKNGTPDMKALNDAFSYMSASRSKLGATVNGLEHSYANNRNTAENQTAAQSRIEDTEYGRAVSDQKKNKVLNDYQLMMQRRIIEMDGMRVRMLQ